MPTQRVVSIAQSVLFATRHLVPFQLRLRRRLALVLGLLICLSGGAAWNISREAVQIIGRDTAPSIVAAQNIRATLADAHTQVIDAFLHPDAAGQPNVGSFHQAIARVSQHLVFVAENITYGEDEREPIRQTITELAEYQRLVGMALAQNGDRRLLMQADKLMRENILPQAQAVEMTNLKYLRQSYHEDLMYAWYAKYAFIAAVVLQLMLMMETQIFMASRFRRMLSPMLLMGMAALAVSGLGFIFDCSDIGNDMRTAKEDAFGSVYALSSALAWTSIANSHVSAYLLASSSDDRAEQETLYRDAAARIYAKQDAQSSSTQFRGEGLLGPMMRDRAISRPMADVQLEWRRYLALNEQVFALAREGRTAQAAALSLGNGPGQTDGAYAKTIAALQTVQNDKQQVFERAIRNAEADVARLWKMLLAVLVAAFVGMGLGLQPKLTELRE
ncbi:hypothetical protein [Chromobacterium sp. IIBBL 290-4]|uniref:hypothetical protein n=1 Tax=Chromobacterium sp. IIBBL 290-4 TaxID=2953890 RepID=UPI0020B750AE|nr:hypothetical protein [Chromobacterium sp. IIBBL 290-4]UTH74562.1 hypothetical protein NKT35_00135 [Chromobacterium sp. IIBBL 290-4]